MGRRGNATEEGARERALADEARFSHLADRSQSVAPVAPEERSERRKKLQRIIGSLGASAMILEGGATLSYLTGVTWWRSERLFALVVPAEGAHFWICPAFEESRARSIIDAPDGPGGSIVSWHEHAHPYAALDAALRERRVDHLLIEPQLRWGFVDRLAERFGRERVRSGHPAVIALRAKKDAHEIALLRRASELTQLALAETAKTLTAGLTGAEIGARVDRAHEKLGMKNPWSVCLIGPAAAEPHGKNREAKLRRGDVLLMDVGASLHGYQSDTTRTFVFDGAPSGEIERAWNAVRDAQRRGFELTRPGTRCRDVDAAARAVFARLGFGEGYDKFTHRLGHGIGLETHEDPYFDGGSDVTLEPGMALTDEPGLYLRGQFGVRIEDVVLVTAGEPDHFGAWQTSIRWPG
jgi:Xaa-Pro dipeptidase